MGLHWNISGAVEMCCLPVSLVQKHLRLAGRLSLQMLLLFAADPKGFDVHACAETLRVSVDDAEDAIQYWVNTGVLCGDAAAQPAEAAQPDAKPAAAAEAAAAPAAVPASRPQPVKPQIDEVVRRQKESAEFSSLLSDVSARFGKPITPGDMQTLLYLYDTAAVPAGVILLIVAYAVSHGKINMRYIEKVALGWSDEGITTVEAAEEHLVLLEQMDEAAGRLKRLTGKARELDYRQRGMAHTWFYVWHCSDELVKLALDYAARQTRPQIAYANTMLGNWHEQGITDAAAAAKTLQKETPAARRNAQTEKSSLDLNAYEQQLQDYVPSLPLKNRKKA